MFFFFLFSNFATISFANVETQTDFHGYVRSSLGFSEAGKTQAGFQAPGAQSKYRLGNEPDTNIELAIDHRRKMLLTDGKSVDTQLFFMADAWQPQGESSNISLSGVPQFYIKFLNVGSSQPMSFWVGRRYFDRISIHMNDHFWLNVGQGAHIGAGVEDWKLSNGELNITLFRYEDKEVSGLGSKSSEQGLLNSTAAELRYKNLVLNSHQKLNFWLNTTQRHENSELNFESRNGWGLGLWLESEGVFKGSNTMALTYRTGPSMVQGPFNARPIRENLNSSQFTDYNLENSSAAEFNNNFLIDVENSWSLQWAFIYRIEDYGAGGKDKIFWTSTGVRPVIYLTEHWNIVTELGVDHIKDEINQREGTVTKETLALQLAVAPKYYARPVLRAFMTLSQWSEDFKGLVGASPGSAPYGNATEGMTGGFQMEAWW